MDAWVKMWTRDEFLSCRSWWTGVSHLPVRMEVSADRVALDTAASVRQAGLVYTATSPAFLARWPPNNKVGFFVCMCLKYVCRLPHISARAVQCFTNLLWCLLLPLLGVEVARLCRNSGQCLDAGNTHYCHCQAGYTGSYCEEQVDECIPNPCQNGATCTDYLGGYSCEVSQENLVVRDRSVCRRRHFRLKPAKSPFFVKELLVWQRRKKLPSKQKLACFMFGINSPRSFSRFLKCVPGYHGVNCSDEINECLSQPCQNGGTCIDLINTYKCSCPRGTQGQLSLPPLFCSFCPFHTSLIRS